MKKVIALAVLSLLGFFVDSGEAQTCQLQQVLNNGSSTLTPTVTAPVASSWTISGSGNGVNPSDGNVPSYNFASITNSSSTSYSLRARLDSFSGLGDRKSVV
jgi:hypothetical protein